MAKYYFVTVVVFCLFFNAGAQSFDEPEKTRFYYDGFLDNIEHVQLNLHIEKFEVNGAFIIEATGEHYFIQGRLAKDKSGIGVWIYNGNQYVAAIEARVVSDDKEFGKKLMGVYKPHEQDTQELILQKIAEFANKNKFSNLTPVTII